MQTINFFDPDPRTWRGRLDYTVEVMRELSRTQEPEGMLEVFSSRMMQIFPPCRRLWMSRRGLLPPQVRINRFSLWKDADHPWSESEDMPILEHGILSELMYGDAPRIIDDLQVAPDDPAYPYLEGQRSLMAIPNYDAGESLNMIVVTRQEPHAFPKEHFADLVWMCNLFNRAAQTLVLSEKLRKAYDQAEHEMQAVARLQQSMLPAEVPQIPTLDLAVHYKPSGQAGGDYYDFFPLPKNRWGILIADVSGHGPAAAMLMAITHSLAKTYSGPPSPPGLLLSYINRHLANHYTQASGTFVTAFYAIYDPDRGTLTYANAGHNAPRLIRSTDTERTTLGGRQRLPLGISEWAEYPEELLELIPGDQVIFYTDGITEAANRSGEPFGPDRLDQALAHRPVGAQNMLQDVLQELNRFTEGLPATDDQTLLVARFVAARNNRDRKEYALPGVEA